jgi:hypothetical protein
MSTSSNALGGLMCFEYSDSISPNDALRTSLDKRSVIPKNNIVPFRPQSIPFRPNNFAPVTNNRPNMIPIRPPQLLPEAFLKMKHNDMQIKVLRQREAFLKQFIDYLNAMKVPSQASLDRLQAGLKYGWRSKTKDEAALERKAINSWVERFLWQNQQRNKVALVA